MAAVFKESPRQSESLQLNENILPPNAISVADLNDPTIVRSRKREAEEYCKALKEKRMTSSNVSPGDITEAKEFHTGCVVAAMMPAIADHVSNANLGAVNATLINIQQHLTTIPAIERQLTAIQQQVTAIQQDLTEVQGRVSNSTARNETDTIGPPVHRGVPVPANFPTTYDAIRNLSARQIYPIETYYGLSHNGGIDQRRNRVRVAYGVRMLFAR